MQTSAGVDDERGEQARGLERVGRDLLRGESSGRRLDVQVGRTRHQPRDVRAVEGVRTAAPSDLADLRAPSHAEPEIEVATIPDRPIDLDEEGVQRAPG